MQYESYEKALKCLVVEVEEPMASRISLKANDFKRRLEYSLENASSMLQLLLKTEETKKGFFEHREIQFKIAGKVFDRSEIREKLFLHSPCTTLPTWSKEIIEKIIRAVRLEATKHSINESHELFFMILFFVYIIG